MHGKLQPFVVSLRRCKLYLCPCNRRLPLMVSFLVSLSIICLLVPSVRNGVLYRVWPNAWREINTLDVVVIKLFSKSYMTNGDAPFSCSLRKAPAVSISSINRTGVRSYSEVLTKALRRDEHQRFLPVITEDEKVALLHTYLIVADAFQKANIEFFMVEGSLLGAHRHRGLVPWDDDIDITVNVSHWRLVRTVLGCIHGYILETRPIMHWKFYPAYSKSTNQYPFIDIFFFTENRNYVWAVTDYLAQTVIFAKKDTYPLTTAQFEGLVVPVPKNTDHILRMLFDYERCQSPSLIHKSATHFSNREMSTIACSSLLYLYDMYHLQS